MIKLMIKWWFDGGEWWLNMVKWWLIISRWAVQHYLETKQIKQQLFVDAYRIAAVSNGDFHSETSWSIYSQPVCRLQIDTSPLSTEKRWFPRAVFDFALDLASFSGLVWLQICSRLVMTATSKYMKIGLTSACVKTLSLGGLPKPLAPL